MCSRQTQTVRALTAVDVRGQVAAGVDPRVAWERCGKPKGEAGIQNMRKRGMKRRKSAPAPPPALAPAERAKNKAKLGRGKPAKGYRLNSAQVKVEAGKQAAAKEQWGQVYVKAVAEWQSRVAAGKTGKGHESADVVAAKFEVPAGTKPITGNMVKWAVREGRVDRPPQKRGPARDLPDELVQGLADFAQLKQVGLGGFIPDLTGTDELG